MKEQTFDINKMYLLLDAYKAGLLGGEKMPEDENPVLDKSSKENYLYFTLPSLDVPKLKVGGKGTQKKWKQ